MNSPIFIEESINLCIGMKNVRNKKKKKEKKIQKWGFGKMLNFVILARAITKFAEVM